MCEGLGSGDERDRSATDLREAVGIVAVPDRDRRTRVALQVVVLRAMDLGVDEQVLIVRIDPHDVRLGGPVGQQRRQRGEVQPRRERADILIERHRIPCHPPPWEPP